MTYQTELLGSGYIPSKVTLQNITTALNIEVNPKKKNFLTVTIDKDEEMSKLEFLLFVLDSMSERKLPITGQFYSAILAQSVRIGGLGKKVASLVRNARVSGETLHDNETPTWGSLLEQLVTGEDKEKNRRENLILPTLRVTIGKRDLRTVVATESRVTFKTTSKRKRVPARNN